MKRSITRPLLLASAVLLGACAVVPPDPYAGAYPANVPGSGYGGYESVNGGYTPAYGTQDPYYGRYDPGYVYPGYPVPQVGVGVIVPAPVIVRPPPIVIVPGHPRNDRRDEGRRWDDRRRDDPRANDHRRGDHRANDQRRDDRRQPDGRASIDRAHPPVVPSHPPGHRPQANVPRQEAFVPRDDRGEADAAPRHRGQPSESRGGDSRGRGAEADRP